MFFDDGWVPITEVTAEVFRRLVLMRASQPAGENQTRGLQAELAISVWEICDAATKVGVTAPGGGIIPASKDLVAWSDPTSLSNEHVDIRAGSVGSSTLTAEDGSRPSEDALRARYGTFLHLPLVMPINSFESSMSFLQEEIREQRKEDPAIPKVAEGIVARAEDGGLLTRDLARREIGADLSRRKFKIAWAMAAQKRPELRLPRRWAPMSEAKAP